MLPERWRAPLVDALLFAGALGVVQLYVKYTVLQFGGLEIAQRALGLERISLLETFRFYAADLVDALVWVPLVFLAIAALLPRGLAISLKLVLALAGALIAAICWGSYVSLGRYPGPELVSDWIRAVQLDRRAVDPTSVMPPRQVAKMVAMFVICAAPLALRRFPVTRSLASGWVLAAWGIVAAIAVWGTLTAGDTIYHRSHLARVADEWWTTAAPELPDPTRLDRPALLALYDDLAFPDGAPPAPAHEASSPPAPTNVIFLILETASARDYTFEGDAARMPRLGELAERGLVARRHFSSYPYSVRANFTLFTSVYDLDSKHMMADFLLEGSPRPMDALPTLLGERGYRTRYYFPNPLLHENEEWLLPYLGFEEVLVGERFDELADQAPSSDPAVARDEALFSLVLEDLEAERDDPTPFFYTIATTLGHAPYPDLRPAKARGTPSEAAELVEALVRFVDGQIGLLVDGLARAGKLESTVLVVTGDHGVRSQADDPSLDLRVINEPSFHVPLVIHHPPSFERPVHVEQLTSHVDVVPTVLSLLGLSDPGWLHQGLPLADPRIAQRVSLFLGGHYFGSNGLHYRGRFFMKNEIARLSYLSDSFLFGTEALVGPDVSRSARSEAERMDGLLEEFRRVQLAWTSWFRTRPD